MASAKEEKKRKILIAVDLSSWAEEAFKCKRDVTSVVKAVGLPLLLTRMLRLFI